MKRLAVVSVLVSGLLLGAGNASAMRCGSQLVLIGDRHHDVLSKCGEPDEREERPEKRYFRVFREGGFFEVLQEVTVEEWTYNLGPNMFVRILRFENGRLVEIETGEYGY
ncbi:DUF2845 domain-containing protein [Desulfuromonas sp. TF]|jgi:hypothetical protein|uniref:DUF2845 domain-containing protein n=1 Tax=Desulfuromonas sp. TF TaxID=1232410 RepID=UPI0003FAA488|nr:DUF2845 domain-containing protein [Desulfuromonas sp. TF]